MSKDYFYFGKLTLLVDYDSKIIKAYKSGLLTSTYIFKHRSITIKDIINIKKEYEKVRIKKTDP